MAFSASIILLLLYFIRPQDWVPGMEGMNVIKPMIGVAVIGLLTRPTNLPRWRMFRSPPEVAMLFFGAYVVWTSAEPIATFVDVGSLVFMGVLATQVLTAEWLLERFLQWWMVALIGLLVMGLLTLGGFDITNAAELIAIIGNRLCLNTWAFNNPNSFGHSMVTLLPLAYFILFYKRRFLSRMVGVIVMVLTVCVMVPTQSKGAFLAGAVGFTASMIFGRRLLVQIIVVLLAVGSLGTLLVTLPRMEGMKNLRADEGVQGRLMAWEQALAVAQNKPTGEGYKTFIAIVPSGNDRSIKATHGSFVKIGADLGRWGMVFYAGMLVVGLRALMLYPGESVAMERARRILFSLVVTFCVSSWMIDRAYHAELFFFLGAIGAYHQLSLRNLRSKAAEVVVNQEEAPPVEAAPEALALPWLAPPVELQPAPAGGPGTAAMTMSGGEPEVITVQDYSHSTAHAARAPERLWTRIGLLDVLLAWFGAEAIFWFWQYLVRAI